MSCDSRLPLYEQVAADRSCKVAANKQLASLISDFVATSCRIHIYLLQGSRNRAATLQQPFHFLRDLVWKVFFVSGHMNDLAF